MLHNRGISSKTTKQGAEVHYKLSNSLRIVFFAYTFTLREGLQWSVLRSEYYANP
jgi:hypothetical protein